MERYIIQLCFYQPHNWVGVHNHDEEPHEEQLSEHVHEHIHMQQLHDKFSCELGGIWSRNRAEIIQEKFACNN